MDVNMMRSEWKIQWRFFCKGNPVESGDDVKKAEGANWVD
jgi:hypothetical protein